MFYVIVFAAIDSLFLLHLLYIHRSISLIAISQYLKKCYSMSIGTIELNPVFKPPQLPFTFPLVSSEQDSSRGAEASTPVTPRQACLAQSRTRASLGPDVHRVEARGEVILLTEMRRETERTERYSDTQLRPPSTKGFHHAYVSYTVFMCQIYIW